MQGQKLSFADKMRYINKPIEQICKLHQKEAKFFCSKIDCQQYTYLCDRCKRENTHSHVDQVLDFYAWMENIVQKINEMRPPTNRIFQSQIGQRKNRGDFQQYLQELKRILTMIENIEMKVLETFRDSKLKIGNYIRKYENYGENTLASKVQFYSNPYLLVNKINSERNDDFMGELKKIFRGEQAEMIDPFNPKYEFINLQNKLKGIIANNSNQIFNLPKEINKTPEILVAEKTFLECQSKPEKVFFKGEVLMVVFKGFTQLVNMKSKQLAERLEKTFTKCSFLMVEGQNNFVAISNANPYQLYSYLNKKEQTIKLDFKISAILLYFCTTKYYCILGKDQGQIVIYDLMNKKISATLQQGHNSKVQFFQPWASKLKLFSCSRTSVISIYKIINKNDEISLQIEDTLNFNLPEIHQLQIYDNILIMLTINKNIYVYDLSLKIHYKSNLMERCSDFDMLSVLDQTETHIVLVTHNQGESWLHSWIIEKGRADGIKLDRIGFSNQPNILFYQLNGSDVWLTRQNESEQKLINFNLAVA